jgi:pimeloyl-ACP methyl ester carboxylesterase
MKSIFIGLLTLLCINSYAQKIQYTFAQAGDSTRNYYVTVFPKGEIKGVLIVLPGFGELPEQTLIDWDVHKFAPQAGLITIIPALGDWSFFYIDSLSHQKLNNFIEEVFKKYDLIGKIFFLGGASFGGTMTLQYLERAYAPKSNLRKPAAVFALDPPLDFERQYIQMTSKNVPKKHPIRIQEDNYISGRIQDEFKTNPKINPSFFWKVSPFAQSDTTHSSLKHILKVPIRIYTEPDINWYIENRSVDYSGINAPDDAAMINWLKAFGNTQAELIITSGKGYRIRQKVRHPHSWTIANSKKLVEWLVKHLK